MDIHVALTDDLAEFVRLKVASGRYRSSTEVVEDALRLLEEQERHPENPDRLRDAWDEGIASGDYRPLDLDTLKAEGRKRLGGKL